MGDQPEPDMFAELRARYPRVPLSTLCIICHDELKKCWYRCLVCYEFRLCESCNSEEPLWVGHESDHPIQCVLAPDFKEEEGNNEDESNQAKDESNQAKDESNQAEDESIQAEDESNQAEDKSNQAEEESNQAKDESNQAEDESNQAKDESNQAEDESNQAKDESNQAKDESNQAEDESNQAEGNLVESTVKSYTCPYCGKKGFTYNTLQEHLITTTYNFSGEGVNCPICYSIPNTPEKLFKNLQEHLTKCHHSENVEIAGESEPTSASDFPISL